MMKGLCPHCGNNGTNKISCDVCFPGYVAKPKASPFRIPGKRDHRYKRIGRVDRVALRGAIDKVVGK